MLSKETFMKEMRAIKEFSDYLDKIEDECQFLFNGNHPAYGCVTDADGNNISLSCLDELWDEIQVEAAIS